MITFFQRKMTWLVLCCATIFLMTGIDLYAADTIKIGVIGPLKFLPGEYILEGVGFAVDEINAAGGVLVKNKKYQVEIIKKDSNELQSIADAVQAMERLIKENKVHFIIGGFNSEPIIAMQEVMGDNKKVWLSTCACDETVTERIGKDYDRLKYFFRVGGPNTHFWGALASQQVMMVVDKLREQLGIKKPKLAVIVEKTIFAENVAKELLETPLKYEIQSLGKWVVSRTASDVTAEMSAIKSSEPHIIFTIQTGPVGVAIAKTWGEIQIPAVLSGGGVATGAAIGWQATNGMCNYALNMDAIGRVEITDKTIPYYDKVVKKTGKWPTFISVDNYDALFILKEAIERAGTIETEDVRAALEKTDYKGAAGRIRFFPKSHKYPNDVMWGPEGITWVSSQWRDRKLVVHWPDGKARLGVKGFENLRYKGTGSLELPPWVIKYWKEKK